MNTSIIPIFPLNLVLFPGIPLPLHIFEERYKEMIRDCREKQEPLGIVLYEGGQICLVGCPAIITKIIREYADRRLDILTEGQHRFVIEKLIDPKALQARVELVEPSDPQITVDNHLHRGAVALMEQILKITGQKVDLNLFKSLNPEQISFLIAAYAGFSTIQKQMLLEINDVSERLSVEVELMTALLERFRFNQLLWKTVHKNGKQPN